VNYSVGNYWIWIAAAAVLVVAVAGWLWRRSVVRKRGGIAYAMRSVAVDELRDVLIPDGMGGQIHIEHLLLTAKGILVLNVKQFTGTIFASDRMDDWTSMGPTGRAVFTNPQGDLYDRVAAVRQLIRDVDVAGFVMFPSDADFSKGRPKDILLPAELLERYARPERADIERHIEAYAPHWEKIRSACQPANSSARRIA
jgi:hypothetical protein